MVILKEENHLSHGKIHRHLRARNLRVSKRDVRLVMETVRDIIHLYEKERPTVRAILEATEKLVNMDLTTATRDRKIIDGRRFFYVVAREFGHSQQSIGDAVGLDHATVFHGVKTHKSLMTDKIYAELFNYRKKAMNEKLYKD